MRSSRDFLVEGGQYGSRGNYDTEEVQIASLYERMDYFLGVEHKELLPDSVVANLLDREKVENKKGEEGDVGRCVQVEDKYGLDTVNDEVRAPSKAVALEIIMKLHKNLVSSDRLEGASDRLEGYHLYKRYIDDIFTVMENRKGTTLTTTTVHREGVQQPRCGLEGKSVRIFR